MKKTVPQITLDYAGPPDRVKRLQADLEGMRRKTSIDVAETVEKGVLSRTTTIVLQPYAYVVPILSDSGKIQEFAATLGEFRITDYANRSKQARVSFTLGFNEDLLGDELYRRRVIRCLRQADEQITQHTLYRASNFLDNIHSFNQGDMLVGPKEIFPSLAM